MRTGGICEHQGVAAPPDFSDDTGAVPDEVAEALAGAAQDQARYAEALGVLQRHRLLLPAVEVPAGTFPEAEEHSHHHDQHHDHDHGPDATVMAAALVQAPDGRRALLAFTGVEPLRRWDPAARPLPVTTRLAAEAAVRERAAALLVDAAGPHRLLIEGADLTALAEGWQLVWVGGRSGWLPAD